MASSNGLYWCDSKWRFSNFNLNSILSSLFSTKFRNKNQVTPSAELDIDEEILFSKPIYSTFNLDSSTTITLCKPSYRSCSGDVQFATKILAFLRSTTLEQPNNMNEELKIQNRYHQIMPRLEITRHLTVDTYFSYEENSEYDSSSDGSRSQRSGSGVSNSSSGSKDSSDPSHAFSLGEVLQIVPLTHRSDSPFHAPSLLPL